ncbi:hypothetical protein COL52_05755 [Bacillus toyonensis]|uniref:Uncharacterized protein n=1 Tax=Bacillus toyonensis TaxID=155322 RepID=A0A2B5C0D2_9BACI|nr:hypothetical protein CN688_24875 [Bacillus toyonensis]PEK78523.1 hypothetical protein CN594_26320 [Bacillus toyonensis]PEL17658.1 hypothetical protein CN624_29545 [Bacillus toyonensis]PFY31962.1 hypothetical protein COL54_32055 [Bacillus toyonensis]PFY44476.1 hypothetical protein COL55_19685 [Bacillus toyonensis]
MGVTWNDRGRNKRLLLIWIVGKTIDVKHKRVRINVTFTYLSRKINFFRDNFTQNCSNNI